MSQHPGLLYLRSSEKGKIVTADEAVRLIPCTIALGAFSFTMDSLPFSPQIQNIIPTTYFKTTNGAAPPLQRARATAPITSTNRSRCRRRTSRIRSSPSCR